MRPGTMSIPVIAAILSLALGSPTVEARHCRGHRHHRCCQPVVDVPCYETTCCETTCGSNCCITTDPCNTGYNSCCTTASCVTSGCPESCCSSGCVSHYRHHHHGCCTTACSVDTCCAQNVVYLSPAYANVGVRSIPVVSNSGRVVVAYVK